MAGAENDITDKNARRRKHVLTSPLHIAARSDYTEIAPLNPALRTAGAEQVYSRPKMLAYQIADISAMLVGEQLGAALERFGACSCDRCCAEITARAMKLLPRVFMHVRSAEDEQAVNEKLAELRPEAVKALARVIISARTNPIH